MFVFHVFLNSQHNTTENFTQRDLESPMVPKEFAKGTDTISPSDLLSEKQYTSLHSSKYWRNHEDRGGGEKPTPFFVNHQQLQKWYWRGRWRRWGRELELELKQDKIIIILMIIKLECLRSDKHKHMGLDYCVQIWIIMKLLRSWGLEISVLLDFWDINTPNNLLPWST